MTAFRRIEEDYEARLTPPASGGQGSGKVEWERMGDGEVQFEIGIRNLVAADGTSVEVRLGGSVVATLGVTKGRAKHRLSSANGDSIPAVQPGDRLEVVQGADVLLEGVFRPD